MDEIISETNPNQKSPKETEKKKIKVLIVDDAAFMRKAILNLIQFDPQIEVVGTARNGQEGLEQIEKLKPDVVTLDIDMPVMDGITGIRHIMIKSPVPIVVLSSLFSDGAITFDALRLGVVDFIPKPSGAVSTDIDHSRQQLIDRIKQASMVNLDNIRRVRLAPQDIVKTDQDVYRSLDYLIAVGTTLSGPNTVIRLLTNLPPTLPAAIVAVLEIAPKIISEFIKRFDMFVPWEICEAQDGVQLKQGVCYVSSSQKAVRIETDGGGSFFLTRVEDETEPLNLLFSSAADVFQQNTVGVLLTGLGTDGADGFARIKELSGETLAQNTQSCVYPNLTDNAIKQGTVNSILDESELPQAIMSIMTR